MKRVVTVVLGLLLATTISLRAQNELPSKFGIIVGGGVSFPYVEGNDNDFFGRNGNRVGYMLSGETRFYFNEGIAWGFKYDYLRASRYEDKMHVNFIAPEIVFRLNNSSDSGGVFLSFAPGYMSYSERVYTGSDRYGHNFDKGYFGLDFALGYEFAMARGVNGLVRLNVLTADWGANPDARLYNPDPDYDDGINHSWFKNNITFVNVGFALQFGK